MKQKIKNILAILIVIAGIIGSCWLSFNVLLVGGVEQMMTGFNTMNVSMSVWGFLRAIFFEMGFILFWISALVFGWLTD